VLADAEIFLTSSSFNDQGPLTSWRSDIFLCSTPIFTCPCRQPP